ncbi:hypothetical protein BGX24_008887 [Mortierella sp. AD032]|nr:hypothetical protein BGX24_008887 [Mortierella sp. AD032]
MDLLSNLMDDCESSGKRTRLQFLYLMAGVLQNFTIQLRQLPSLTTLTTLRIDKPPPPRYPFYVLFTAGWAFPNIEELVFQKTSPNLSKLVLFQCTYGSLSTPRHPAISTYVAAHCPNLRTFHLSMFEVSDDVIGRELTSYIFIPNLDELSVVDQDFYRRIPIRDGLRNVANRVTTLNILPFSDTMGPIIVIRDVLCTFDHLVHLRAPNAVYSVEDMDLNNHLLQFKQDSTTMHHCPRYHHPTPFSVKNVGNGYIWACRGLKTLHLSIGPAFGNNSSPETMLIVFGFLSRMCPLLEEVYLSGWVMDLSFREDFAC